MLSPLALNLHDTSLLISYTNSLLQFYVIAFVVLSLRGEFRLPLEVGSVFQQGGFLINLTKASIYLFI
jgi:hypothetical protein